jgi:tripartite-type tricarboxylate transporter receptor subunit TctC
VRRPGRRRLLVALGALAGSVLSRAGAERAGIDGAAAHTLPDSRAGADWPPPRVRLIVAYPVGGLSSEVARTLAEALSGVLAVPVVLDHRPGAGGTLAIDAVAKPTPTAA